MLQELLRDCYPNRSRSELHILTGHPGAAIEPAHTASLLALDECSLVDTTDFVVGGILSRAHVTPKGPAIAAPRN